MSLVAFKTVYSFLALGALPGVLAGLSRVLAGPACVQRNRGRHDCVEKCERYSGFVIKTSDSTLSTACGLVETPISSGSLPLSGTPTTDSIRDEALAEHNSFRALYGAPPLVWNGDLAAAAGSWVSQCVYESGGNQGVYGENLAAGPSDFTITDGIKSWTAEAADYSLKDIFDHVHFAQVVWKGTTDIGCAIVSCPPGTIGPEDSRFLACEYYPPGLFSGQFEENVQG